MSRLQKNLSLVQGIGLAVSTIMGSGLLGLPGLAIESGGTQAAAVGWLLTTLMALPLMLLFMKLALRVQDAGGISRYAEIAFGAWAEAAVIVILAFTFALCIPVGTYMGSAYIQKIFALPEHSAFWIAAGILLISTVINCIGVRQSAWINNLAVIALIALICLLVVSDVTLLSRGVETFGQSMATLSDLPVSRLWAVSAILFWAFLGWENLSFGSEEVKGGQRTIRRIYWASFGVVVLLYTMLAIVSVGASAAGLQVSGVTGLLALVEGKTMAPVVYGFIILIVVANVNAWVFAASRLFFSAGRSGVLPDYLGVLGANGMPRRSLMTLFGLHIVFVAAIHSGVIPLSTGLAIASQNFALLYLASIICFAKLNRAPVDRMIAIFALLACTFLLSGFAWWLLLPVGLAMTGYLIHKRRKAGGGMEARTAA